MWESTRKHEEEKRGEMTLTRIFTVFSYIIEYLLISLVFRPMLNILNNATLIPKGEDARACGWPDTGTGIGKLVRNWPAG